MGHRTGLDGCGKYRTHRDSIPGPIKKAYPDVINIISGQLYVCHMRGSRKAEGVAL